MVEAVLHRLLGSYRDCVSAFVVPSRFYIDKFVEWGMPRTLFRHVPNFVDVTRYRPQYAPGKAFVYFGRISPEKGLATLIRAVAAADCPTAGHRQRPCSRGDARARGAAWSGGRVPRLPHRRGAA